MGLHSSGVPSSPPDRLVLPLTPPQAVDATWALRWPGAGRALVVLAHSAGGAPDSRLLVGVAGGLAAAGHEVWSWAAPARAAGRRGPEHPNRLFAAWVDVLGLAAEAAAGRPLLVGGHSMGGRLASMVVAAGEPAAAGVAGLVLLGYPLIPPRQDPAPPAEVPRAHHWPDLRLPVLLVHGDRDPFATPDQLRDAAARLPGPATVAVLERAGHSLSPGRAAAVVTGWVNTVATAGGGAATGRVR
jgi:predicted alpha/beta-hydrolase family hydrolase